MKYERGSAKEETATRANGATMIEVVSRYLARTIIVAGCPGGLSRSTRSLVRPRRFRFASVLRHRRLASSSVFKIGANGIYAAIATVKRRFVVESRRQARAPMLLRVFPTRSYTVRKFSEFYVICSADEILTTLLLVTVATVVRIRFELTNRRSVRIYRENASE